MVTTETHQSQDLLVPPQVQEDQVQQDQVQQDQVQQDQALASALLAGLDLDQMGSGPVNAITVLTLLDKLVHMLDAVQENQHKMEVHQVQMEVVVQGIQAEMTKLSKNQNHTNNNVSKLLERSRKISVTMKEVRERMERQGAQVKKLEANHAHLVSRNGFKVLIFQEENEIPASVFVKDPPPFPRDDVLKEGEEPGPGEENQSQEALLQPIDLSSDEDAGLGEEPEDEDAWFQPDAENPEKTRAEKLKRSSLKKVDSLKKAFSRQNIEKKMTKIGTKIVSVEQREKIKQRTSSLKVSPLSFSLKKPRADSHPAEEVPLGRTEEEVPFTEVHTQLAPENELEEKEEELEQEEKEKENEEEAEKNEEKEEKEEEKDEEKEEEKEEVAFEVEAEVEAEVSAFSEGISEEFALSSTLPLEERRGGDE